MALPPQLTTFASNIEVNSVQFSSDTRMIISGSSDGTIKLWSIIDDEKNIICLRTIFGHK